MDSEFAEEVSATEPKDIQQWDLGELTNQSME
jgi:hypothetical protein